MVLLFTYKLSMVKCAKSKLSNACASRSMPVTVQNRHLFKELEFSSRLRGSQGSGRKGVATDFI